MVSNFDTNNYLSVSNFFQNKSVFITGATGFMGKVLVEKLLRSCPGIKNIYLLIRPKKEQDIKTRLTELLSTPLFDRLRKERPLQLNKIVPILGDITEPKLGLSTSDETLLIRTVSIVFHAAATVKFNEALKLSVAINMIGTKQLVELCHRMLNLEAFVHVSTTYCNCDREDVNEVIYSRLYDPEKIIQSVSWMDEKLLQTITSHLIGTLPNTYTFTKALAEHIIVNESGNLPVAIVRPSIVLSSLREPIPGWLDNCNGPTSIVIAAGKGYFRSMFGHENKITDIVPVDLVINLMICAAWRIATTKPNEISIYNCCTGQQNPITWKNFFLYSYNALRRNPIGDAIWYPGGKCRSNQIINSFYQFTYQVIPAYVLDFYSRLTGKKPVMVGIQSKLRKVTKCLEYFTTRQWRFTDENVKSLNDCLSSEDNAEFNFDVTKIVWSNYIEDYVLGSALNWAEQGLKVVYISPTEMKELPTLFHGTSPLETETLKLLQIIYLASKQSLLTYLYNLTIKEKLPRGIFVENLDTFSDFSKNVDTDGSLVCASLLNAINSCANKSSLPCYLATAFSVPYKNLAMNPYNFFNTVWTCTSDCNHLTKLVKHPEEPKIEMKLLLKNNTFHLEEIKTIYVK